MSDSKHWRDDGAPADFERLLSAARSETPPPEGAQRALVAAGVIGAASLASATVSATAGNAVSKLVLVKWFAIGVIGAGAVTVATQVERGRTDAAGPPGPAESSLGARSSSLVRPAPERAVATSTALAALPTSMPRAVPSDLPKRTASSGLAASKDGEGDRTFAEELALLDTARSKWRAGNAAGAIQSASEYRRRFPAGRFAPEALFLLMQARLELKQEQDARNLASELVRRFPNTPHAARAREVLEQSVDPPQKP